MTSEQMREAVERFRARPESTGPVSMERVRQRFAPAGVRYELPDDVLVAAVDAGGVPAHWVSTPGAAVDRVLLFLHGGAYRTGSFSSHGELAARLGRAAGIRVLAVDYRLAPEQPFPAAIDDALAAWHWLTKDQGVAADRIVVAGDSAGGGLSLALLIAVRDAGDPLPRAAALMSPWTDLSCSGASMSDRAADDPVLSPERVRGFAADYLAGADPHTPLASPLFAEHAGLPPLLIQVGTAEILLSDSQRLADRAARAGVDVELQVTENAPHVFQAIRDAPEAAAAIANAADFFRERLDA